MKRVILCELIADEDSVPRVVVVLGEGNRFKDLKRGVLSEDGLYDLLSHEIK